MKFRNIVYCALLLTLPLTAQNEQEISHIVDSIKQEHIKDARESIFEITVETLHSKIFLSGSVSDQRIYIELQKALKNKKYKNIQNNVTTLPSKTLADTLYGVVNVSVADIKNQNKFTSAMVTQTILGTPIKLLDKQEWYRVQMPDSYFGWIHAKQVVAMNRKQYNTWIVAPKVVFTQHYGFSYAENSVGSEHISDLVAGNLLRYRGVDGDFFKVEYPDGRQGFVLRSESQEYALWLQSRKLSAESFVRSAISMMGIPYVWGGTSTKGLDCSGLVATIMQLHGLYILRDASQQANLGEGIELDETYANLKIGDLLFFGTENNIRHVGLYLGNMQFIHTSGWVRVSSFDPKDKNYDELNTKEFVKARRIIENGKLYGINRIKDNNFYFIQNK